MIYIVYIPTFYSSDFIVFRADHGFQSGQYKSADESIESFANNWIEREVSVGSKCPSFKFLFLRTQVKLCKFKHVYTCVHFAGTSVFSSSQIFLWILSKREGPPSSSIDRRSSEKYGCVGGVNNLQTGQRIRFLAPKIMIFVADIWGSITIMICGDEWCRD